ncbi:Glyoxalase/Bleomycin resistance protein/Dihydroxybiphenyl dioxygenase [Trichoderma barbatum]
MPIQSAFLRIARPSDNINALIPFYVDGLGFELLYRFNQHEEFDGIILGHKAAGYHLEFTAKNGHTVGRAPTEDNLLVFYLPEGNDFNEAVTKMEKAGFSAVKSFNPYWDRCGKTFEDADGYRVVLVSNKSPFLNGRDTI